jgi:hypothetical protein
MDIQFAFVAIVHVHSRAALMATDPDPPLAVNDAGATLTLIWHLLSAPAGPRTDVVVDVQLERAAASTTPTGTQQIFERIRFTAALADARASPSEKVFSGE